MYVTLRGVGRTQLIVYKAVTVKVSNVYFHPGHWSYFIEDKDH